jgi:hypothetical protein
MSINQQSQNTAIRMATVLLVLSTLITAQAQTTAFTYQGRLSDGGPPANGTYDLQFALFDSLAGGAQVGSTQTVSSVSVSAGIFTVPLDFGASAFSGANRWLEIRARLTGTTTFTTLLPRQQITSTPYAIRSLNASSADTVVVNGVPAGSGNYVQNATAQQASSNFNITGNGTAGGTLSGGSVNATTQYNLGGSRILSADGASGNMFAGFSAGQAITTGFGNTFIGFQAGLFTTTGSNNSFFGDQAGRLNTSGNQNTFVGRRTGLSNLSGSDNTLLGNLAVVGVSNLTNATAIGAYAQVDQSNSLVLGGVAGTNSVTTSVNVGIGTTTPQATLDVNGSALFHAGATVMGTALFQGGATVTGTALFQGGATVTGTNGDGAVVTARRPTGDPYIIIDATNVAQNSVLAFRKNNFNRWLLYSDATAESGGNAGSDFRLDAYNNLGGIANYLSISRATGQLSVSGRLKLDQIDSGVGAGTTQLCRNIANVIATCSSSSLRYKQDITPFNGGLDLIRRLHPISFTWKADSSRDLGLGAEDVAKVEPLLITHNDKGEIEGVRYDRLNVVLINAIKQQQQQIEMLRAENEALNLRLRSVERFQRKRRRGQRK